MIWRTLRKLFGGRMVMVLVHEWVNMIMLVHSLRSKCCLIAAGEVTLLKMCGVE